MRPRKEARRVSVPQVKIKELVAMANGWAPDSAVQDQIDATIMDAVLAARSRLPSGMGSAECTVCGDDIPEKRRIAIPGVRTCVTCQSARDKRPAFGGINRRGSKDSQLR